MPDPFGEFYDQLNKILKDNGVLSDRCYTPITHAEKFDIRNIKTIDYDYKDIYPPYPIIKDSKPTGSENIKKGGNNMGYSKKAKAAEANAEEKMITISDIEVTRASEIKEGTVAFDMTVRGIAIQGCFMRQYTNKEGAEGDLISFPSYKGNNGKYYNFVWFPISKELKEQLKEKIISLLG